MEAPSAKDIDVTSEDLDNCPPGTTLHIFPWTREYMADPMWFDQIGRDPIRARKIFRRWDEGELTRDQLKTEINNVLDEWPRYGPAVYEKAAKEGRYDVVELMLEMGIACDPKTMKSQPGEGSGDEGTDENEPLYEPDHAYLAAIMHGHLDVVKLLVEKGGVSINYEDPDDGLINIAFAVRQGNPPEVTRWLLDHGAKVTLSRDDGIGDVQSAIKSGGVQQAEMLLAHPQVVDSGWKISPDDLSLAAHSGNAAMVELVLRSECFGIEDPDAGLAGNGEIELDSKQQKAIVAALAQAAHARTAELVMILLRQLTPIGPDGAFIPFPIPDDERTAIFNGLHEALEFHEAPLENDPAVFGILWDTVLHQSPSQESIDRRVGLPSDEYLFRAMISACARGCVATVRLLVERYGVDVNRLSHKYFSTPLTRAAGSGNNPLPGRLEVVKYLCSRPDLNLELASGEFCNGETALALAVQEAYFERRHPELAQMVGLLLEYGGPVDEITLELRHCLESAEPDDAIQVHVLWANGERRKPVILAVEDREGCIGIVLEFSVGELRIVLRGIKIRSDDEKLRAEDLWRRPLMPREGEEIPEEERAKPTLLNDGVVMDE